MRVNLLPIYQFGVKFAYVFQFGIFCDVNPLENIVSDVGLQVSVYGFIKVASFPFHSWI